MNATNTIIAIYVFFIGLIIGSFLNVVIYRLPRKESLAAPRSKCPQCGRQIRWYDNIPLVSFVILRGKCRDCSELISWRYPLVELLTGMLFLAIFLQEISLAPTILTVRGILTLVAFLYFGAIMVAVTFIDAEFQIVPDKITYPALLIGPLLLLAADPGRWRGLLIGFCIGGGVLFLVALIKGGGMGGGDIKLGAVMGVFLGAKVAVALFFGVLVGALVGITLIIAKRKTMKDAMAFGPFLALGSIFAYFYGQPILTWYLSFFSH